MNNIQIFQNEQFGKVRIAMNESNEPLFCLADVCGVIGIANARNVRSRLEEDDVRQMDTIDSLGRNQQVTFITESGLYDVIIRSDSEKAKPFRKWVTSEVLPSIRKHGAYMTSDTLEKALTSPDFLIQLAINLKEEKQKRIEAEQKIQKDAPKVLFADAEGGNLAASKIRNLECPSYEICLIDYGCGKFNRKIHIMEQYP